MKSSARRLIQSSSRLLNHPTSTPAISYSHIQESFPPKEAVWTPGRGGKPPPSTYFSTTNWAALQPPPPQALAAFAHRVGLASILIPEEGTAPTDLVQQALTHSSFTPFYAGAYPAQPPIHSNAQLATTGNALLGLFASEHVSFSYPHLPTRVLKAVVSAHVGDLTCANVAKEMGAAPLVRWYRTSAEKNFGKEVVMHSTALASVPRALIALVHQKKSLASARKFAQTFFLSRDVDIRSMLKFRDPKKALVELVEKFGRERPKSRLLKETGRFTNSPVFVVGIYSGADELGQGFGSSLKMAEFRVRFSFSFCFLHCTDNLYRPQRTRFTAST